MKKLARKLLNKILSIYHYRLTENHTVIWPEKDQEFLEIFELQKTFGGWAINGPKAQRMYMVRNLLLQVKNPNADMAECGVFKGSTSLLIAEYCKRYKLISNNSSIHLFDSFAGLSDPTAQDQGTSMQKGEYCASLTEVKNNLSKYNCFSYHPGWIPEKFNSVSDKRFSFVHIDVDLYNPVKDSLEFFIPRMVEGGLIVLDDYGYNDTPGALSAVDQMAQKHSLHVGRLPFGQAYISF